MHPSQLRRLTLSARVNATQKKRIRRLADACGMTVSDYIVARCCDYEPKARLNPDETRAINLLGDIRSDIRRFFARYNSLSTDERGKVLGQTETMQTWFLLVADLGNRIDPIITRLTEPNHVPGAQAPSAREAASL